jgi:hypothetical protein
MCNCGNTAGCCNCAPSIDGQILGQKSYNVTGTIYSATSEALNGFIGVEKFRTNNVEKKEKHGFAVVSQKVELTPLTVLYGTDKIPTGSTVYVRGDLCATRDAQTIYSIGTQEFILIPVAEVKIVARTARTAWSYPIGGQTPWFSLNTQPPVSLNTQPPAGGVR